MEAFVDALVEVTSIKAFLKAFNKVSFIEASIEFFVEAPNGSVEVTSMEAFVEA